MTIPTSILSRVLLIDDDESVLRIVSRILTINGFDVRECASGADALEAVTAEPTGFDVVVCDAVMPGTSGPETARQLAEISPSTPIVFVSGLGDQDLRAIFGNMPVGRFIQKPFHAAELVAVLRCAIEAREALAA